MFASDYTTSSGGSSKLKIQQLGINGSVLDWGYMVNCDASSGKLVATLPTSTTFSIGKFVIIKKTDSSVNPVVIYGYSNDTIDDTNNPIYLYNKNDSIMIVSTEVGKSYSAPDNRNTIYAQASYISMTNSADITISSGTAFTFDTKIDSAGSDIAYSGGVFTINSAGSYHITFSARQVTAGGAMNFALCSGISGTNQLNSTLPLASSNANTQQGDNPMDFIYQFTAGTSFRIVCLGGSGSVGNRCATVVVKKESQPVPVMNISGGFANLSGGGVTFSTPSTWMSIPFSTVKKSNDITASASATPVTITRAGLYRICANGILDSNGGTYGAQVRFTKNGTPFYTSNGISLNDTASFSFETSCDFAVGDVIAIQGLFSAGTTNQAYGCELIVQQFGGYTVNMNDIGLVGEIKTYAGAIAPSGWLLCDGQAISRAMYPSLFAVIGTMYGYGDNNTTFNLPDMRGRVLRGSTASLTNILVSSISSNIVTVSTPHNLNRTGLKIRLISGSIIGGLSTGVTYYAIVLSNTTFKVASSFANAIAGTAISITPVASATFVQWEDPDASSRVSSTVGGNSGNTVGSMQDDMYGSHSHGANLYGKAQYANGSQWTGVDPGTRNSNYGGGSIDILSSGGNETRMANIAVNYIIKY